MTPEQNLTPEQRESIATEAAFRATVLVQLEGLQEKVAKCQEHDTASHKEVFDRLRAVEGEQAELRGGLKTVKWAASVLGGLTGILTGLVTKYWKA